MKDNKSEIEILKFKVKLLTFFLIVLGILQVIDFLRLSAIEKQASNFATLWTTNNLERSVENMQNDIFNMKSDIFNKADTYWVNRQIEDVYRYITDYCKNYCG